MYYKNLYVILLLVISFSTQAQVGINTADPSETLDVNGTARFRSYVYDGDNSNGTEGQVLKRSNTGVRWEVEDRRIPSIVGDLSTVITAPAANIRIDQRVWTGASITIPPGRYQVMANMLLTINNNRFDNFGDVLSYDEGYWIKTTFTDSQTDQNPSADLVGSNLISGGINGVQRFSLIRGTLVINNTSGADKTYYYWTNFDGTPDVYGSGSRFKYLIGVGSTLWGENQIIAQPIE